jgi:hypothetical protein
MTITCPRSPEAHTAFRRVVTVEGPTIALLDSHGDVLQYEDCGTFRTIRSTSDIRCASCGSKPSITIA